MVLGGGLYYTATCSNCNFSAEIVRGGRFFYFGCSACKKIFMKQLGNNDWSKSYDKNICPICGGSIIKYEEIIHKRYKKNKKGANTIKNLPCPNCGKNKLSFEEISGKHMD